MSDDRAKTIIMLLYGLGLGFGFGGMLSFEIIGMVIGVVIILSGILLSHSRNHFE